MPTVPEFLEAASKVRLAEVDHEMEAKQLSAAAGEVAVTAEIAVDLPGESVHGDQQTDAAMPELSGKGGVGQQRAVIGDDALAE